MVGADPSFGDVHVLRTLFALESGVVGRKRLVKLLGVGEGSVRTIIKRLSSRGFLSSSKSGHSLTEAGRREALDWLALMSKPAGFDAVDLVGGSQSLVVVYGAVSRVGKGVALRDLALKAGADGALILVYDGTLRFPDSSMDLAAYPNASKKLSTLALNPSDVAAIGFAGSKHKAEDGALALAMELTAKTLS